jgi:hypothetical protein
MPEFTDRLLAAVKVKDGRKDRRLFDNICRGLSVSVTLRGLELSSYNL